jgi:hypothetical protein
MSLDAASWAAIQSNCFPNHRGTAFQNKMKDKWRVLCQGLKKKQATRSNLPEHLWQKVEALAKMHAMT